MKFDDDIPVLTDILRPRTKPLRAVAPPVEPPPEEPDDLLALDLLIGNDARTAIESYTRTEVGANDAEADPQPAMLEPLDPDRAGDAGSERPIQHDYFAHATSSEAERGALLASEDADGLHGRPVPQPANESVSVEAGGSIDAPEATEGEQALVDASSSEDVESQVETEALAIRVHDAVLQDLASRIDTELDARIAQALRFELEVALASLQGGLREQLASSLRDVVHRAVKDEITRLNSDGTR